MVYRLRSFSAIQPRTGSKAEESAKLCNYLYYVKQPAILHTMHYKKTAQNDKQEAFEIKWPQKRVATRAFSETYGVEVRAIRPDNPFAVLGA